MMLEAGGGYLGSTLGAFAYDLLGFQWATVVESGVSLSFSSSTKDKDFLTVNQVMAGTVLITGIYMLARRIS